MKQEETMAKGFHYKDTEGDGQEFPSDIVGAIKVVL